MRDKGYTIRSNEHSVIEDDDRLLKNVRNNNRDSKEVNKFEPSVLIGIVLSHSDF